MGRRPWREVRKGKGGASEVRGVQPRKAREGRVLLDAALKPIGSGLGVGVGLGVLLDAALEAGVVLYELVHLLVRGRVRVRVRVRGRGRVRVRGKG